MKRRSLPLTILPSGPAILLDAFLWVFNCIWFYLACPHYADVFARVRICFWISGHSIRMWPQITTDRRFRLANLVKYTEDLLLMVSGHLHKRGMHSMDWQIRAFGLCRLTYAIWKHMVPQKMIAEESKVKVESSCQTPKRNRIMSSEIRIRLWTNSL